MHKLLTSAKVATAVASVSALAICSAPLAVPSPEPGGANTQAAYRLGELVLRANELPGFVPIVCALAQTDVTRWANGDRTTRAALRRDGFVMGVREPLHATVGHATALSVAATFRSSAGASRDVARQLASARQVGAVTTFAVAGIPGAYGFSLSAGGAVRQSIVYTVGASEYLVGVELPDAERSATTPAQLLAAAELVYTRAGGGGTHRNIRVAVNHK